MDKFNILIHFLKENNAYESFLYNIKLKSLPFFFRTEFSNTFKEYINSSSPKEIFNIFEWKDTTEGINFWYTLFGKWLIRNNVKYKKVMIEMFELFLKFYSLNDEFNKLIENYQNYIQETNPKSFLSKMIFLRGLYYTKGPKSAWFFLNYKWVTFSEKMGEYYINEKTKKYCKIIRPIASYVYKRNVR